MTDQLQSVCAVRPAARIGRVANADRRLLSSILAMLLTPAVDGVAKTLSADHSPMMIAFLRYFCRRADRAGGRRAAPGGGSWCRAATAPASSSRTALIMGAMTALIAALGMVPMAKAVGGFLIAPIVSGLLGILVWREPPTATAAGRLGDQLPRRRDPDAPRGRARARLPVRAARRRAARHLSRGDPRRAQPRPIRSRPWRCSRCSARRCSRRSRCAGGLPTLTPALLWRRARRSAAISAVCHFLTVAAYQRAEATVLAPFLYFNMLTAMAVGFFWFGETLGHASLVGLVAIAAGGLVTLIDPRRVALPRSARCAARAAARPRFA